MRVLGYGILTLTLGLGLFGAYTYRHLNENLTNLDLREQLGDDRPDIEVPKGDGRPLNVLVMGSDTRAGGGNDPVGGEIAGPRHATRVVEGESGSVRGEARWRENDQKQKNKRY